MVANEFLEMRHGAEYRAELDQVLPGALAQVVVDAWTTFEQELPALREWRFGEAEARRVTQPVLAVLGDRSNDLSPRFVETKRLLLEWLPHAEGFVLPGAAHGLQMQNPSGMAGALADFFARHPLPA